MEKGEGQKQPYMATKDGPSFCGQNEMVKFIVGPEKAVFTAHKNFVTYRSPVLEAGFSSYFTEGQRNTYILDETEPKVFEMFLRWTYGQTMANILPAGEAPNSLDLYIRLWIFADRYQVPQLQNSVMQWLCGEDSKKQGITYIFSLTMAREIYDKTRDGSPLRKWVASQLAVNFLGNSYLPRDGAESGIISQEIILDIMEASVPLIPAGTVIRRPNGEAFLVSEDVPDIKKGRVPASDYPLEYPNSHADTKQVSR